jgi:hypothetical protein
MANGAWFAHCTLGARVGDGGRAGLRAGGEPVRHPQEAVQPGAADLHGTSPRSALALLSRDVPDVRSGRSRLPSSARKARTSLCRRLLRTSPTWPVSGHRLASLRVALSCAVCPSIGAQRFRAHAENCPDFFRNFGEDVSSMVVQMGASERVPIGVRRTAMVFLLVFAESGKVCACA